MEPNTPMPQKPPMSPEQVERINKYKEEVAEVKKQLEEILKGAEVTDEGTINNSVVVFSFVNGQPKSPMFIGHVDKDIFAALSEDFVEYLTVREKEIKISQISDNSLRARLLEKLRANLK